MFSPAAEPNHNHHAHVCTLGSLGYYAHFMLLLHVLQFTYAFPTLIQEEFALE